MTVSIRLDADLKRRLHLLAEKTGKTKAYYMRSFIENGLNDIEDFYLAEVMMNRILKGCEDIHDAEKVRKMLA